LICGRSLGTGIAAELARKLCERKFERLKGLVLWSPITSVAGVASSFVGFLSVLVQKHWDVVADVGKVDCCPVLVSRGQLVPFGS
jgi:acetyl esterase/lipase